MHQGHHYFDRAFDISLPALEQGGWWIRICGIRKPYLGPFETESRAYNVRDLWFKKWSVRAQALEGWVWKKTEEVWVVTTPHCALSAGRPLQQRVCSKHTG